MYAQIKNFGALVSLQLQISEAGTLVFLCPHIMIVNKVIAGRLPTNQKLALRTANTATAQQSTVKQANNNKIQRVPSLSEHLY